ncbi:nitrogen regulatory IIA protein [Chryseobacterium indologenes]|uniref:nitrogen regulatory IIA protein n=1 Tax=Chryseobacterium indologenes TaxID=253 RepID=UPI000B518BFF|nr:nitrogen regulatory IIA protein [Chryseobacterium indologenes]ASE62060.1 nitrogen regulatory IIA protein [Chryseobacterium indologenes]
MNLRTKIENRINDLDDRWRELPVKKQRKYTLYFFLCYTILTLFVVAKVCVETGEVDPEIAIRHIENPVGKAEKLSQNKRDSISINLKKESNGK